MGTWGKLFPRNIKMAGKARHFLIRDTCSDTLQGIAEVITKIAGVFPVVFTFAVNQVISL
jgi:hypothetical protein